MQLFLSPDFNIKTLRKKPKSAEQKFKEWHQKIQDQHLTSLAKLLGSYVPQTLFEREAKDRQTRQRIFTVENTFWGFLLQTLQADSSCQSIVHQLKAKVSKTRKKTISSSTSAYCQARAKLSHSLLQDIFAHTANHSSRHIRYRTNNGGLNNVIRRVDVPSLNCDFAVYSIYIQVVR